MVRQSVTRTNEADPEPSTAPALVGRERELAILTAALSGQPAVLLLEGGPGVGKSRLLSEFLGAAQRQQRRSLVTWCPPYREPYTLGPVIDAVRQATDRVDGLGLSELAGALRPLFPEWTQQLPPAPPRLGDAKGAQHRLFRALAEVLEHLDVGVLAVEDVHWADDATMEFLLFLAYRQPPTLSLVVTYRLEDLPDVSLLRRLLARPAGGCRTVPVPPLDVGMTAELVSSMLDGESVSVDFAEFVYRHTDGNPLAVEESVRLMRDRADLTRRDGEWVRRRLAEIEVPDTVRDAVVERVARLAPQAQLVLRAVAVLTDAADDATVAAVSGLPVAACNEGIDEAVGSGLLRDEHELVSYRHALACRAVYESIPATERRSMHGRAGQRLVDQAPAARLAEHFRASGDTERWCHYAESAADLALAAGDEVSACGLLFGLLTGTSLPATAVLRVIKKFPFEVFSGPARFAALVGAIRRTLADPDLPATTEAAIRRQLSRVLMVMEEYEQGRAEAERAIETGALEPMDAARAMRSLSRPQGEAWPKAVHLRWLERAQALIAEQDVPAAEMQWYTVGRMASLLMLGEESGWAEAEQIPEQVTDTELSGSIAAANLNLGDAAVTWGRYAEASRRLDAATVIADEHHYIRLRDIVDVVRLHLDWFTGSWEGLAVRAAAAAANDDMQPVSRREANLVAGLMHRVVGEFERAEEQLQVVLAAARRSQIVSYLHEPAGALAGMYLEQGRVVDALRVTDDPVRLLAVKDMWLWATDVAPARVRALLVADRIGEAADLVDRFTDGLGDRDAPAARASLVLCRTILDGDGAATSYARVAEAWDALPRPYDALLAREQQALTQVATEPEAGRALLAEVFRGLSRLGAQVDADRVASALRRLGVDVRHDWRRGRRGYGDELSPREREVVRLVVTGMTNREVARELSRSPKTVATQLSSAMRKLGVTSRTALAARAVEADLTGG